MRGVLFLFLLPAVLAASLMVDPRFYPAVAAAVYLLAWWRMRR